MREQMFCSKCGKVNWSQYSKTCECKNADFSCNTYEEFLEKQEEKVNIEISLKKKDVTKVVEFLKTL